MGFIVAAATLLFEHGCFFGGNVSKNLVITTPHASDHLG
jgi:hypothetical protein